MQKVDRTTHGLRSALFEQLDGLRDGSKTPQEAKAVSGLASQIISITRLEMDAARFISDSTSKDSNVKQIDQVKL